MAADFTWNEYTRGHELQLSGHSDCKALTTEGSRASDWIFRPLISKTNELQFGKLRKSLVGSIFIDKIYEWHSSPKKTFWILLQLINEKTAFNQSFTWVVSLSSPTQSFLSSWDLFVTKNILVFDSELFLF